MKYRWNDWIALRLEVGDDISYALRPTNMLNSITITIAEESVSGNEGLLAVESRPFDSGDRGAEIRGNVPLRFRPAPPDTVRGLFHPFSFILAFRLSPAVDRSWRP